MTYKLETILLGGLTALMILTNGQLSRMIGNAAANVVIHLIGLGGCLIWLIFQLKRQRPIGLKHKVPLTMFSGGLIGYLTVWLTNASFMGLGVASTLALAIAGQTLFATGLDATGWLGVKKRQIHPAELLSLCLALLGAMILAIGGQS